MATSSMGFVIFTNLARKPTAIIVIAYMVFLSNMNKYNFSNSLLECLHNFQNYDFIFSFSLQAGRTIDKLDFDTKLNGRTIIRVH
jgi:hypothetical protein